MYAILTTVIHHNKQPEAELLLEYPSTDTPTFDTAFMAKSFLLDYYSRVWQAFSDDNQSPQIVQDGVFYVAGDDCVSITYQVIKL